VIQKIVIGFMFKIFESVCASLFVSNSEYIVKYPTPCMKSVVKTFNTDKAQNLFLFFIDIRITKRTDPTITSANKPAKLLSILH